MNQTLPPPDPFRFGWRYVQQIRANGSKVSVQVPLTLDDVLHPQEGDHIPEKIFFDMHVKTEQINIGEHLQIGP